MSHPAPDPAPQAPLALRLVRVALRLAAIIALAYALHRLLGLLQIRATESGQSGWVTAAVVLMLIAYALAMAVPFLPGIEIGVILMMMRGAEVAPFVYAGTVTGLTAAFLVGRYLPWRLIERFADDLGLVRLGAMLARIEPLDREERLALLRARLPGPLAPFVTDWRYVLIGVLLNLPGNGLLGGGGGIAMLAGLSRLYATGWTILTFAIAVSPVPIAVMIWGTDVLK